MSCTDYLYRNMSPKEVSRRWFLQQCGVGWVRRRSASFWWRPDLPQTGMRLIP